MPAIKPYQSPWEAAQALVADHVMATYNIPNADPLKLVAELAFGPAEVVRLEDGTVEYIGPSPELRLAAAKTLLQYTRPQVKAIHMQVDGQIDHNHSQRVNDATEKAQRLLSALGVQRYHSGKAEEAEVVEVGEALSQSLKH